MKQECPDDFFCLEQTVMEDRIVPESQVKIEESSKKNHENILQSDGGCFTCKLCNVDQRNQRNYRRHMNKHKKETNRMRESHDKKSHLCEICAKWFTKTAFYIHVSIRIINDESTSNFHFNFRIDDFTRRVQCELVTSAE